MIVTGTEVGMGIGLAGKGTDGAGTDWRQRAGCIGEMLVLGGWVEGKGVSIVGLSDHLLELVRRKGVGKRRRDW